MLSTPVVEKPPSSSTRLSAVHEPCDIACREDTRCHCGDFPNGWGVRKLAWFIRTFNSTWFLFLQPDIILVESPSISGSQFCQGAISGSRSIQSHVKLTIATRAIGTEKFYQTIQQHFCLFVLRKYIQIAPRTNFLDSDFRDFGSNCLKCNIESANENWSSGGSTNL